ncbi:hypothetical protein [Rhodovulum strictum]|uniref:hypothetical protein n=1 Tax=Rhodovulum strictum TaxID=58314 RepID=UPI00129C0AD9|nr:hypothetical protein [Rhodovulum strictum]
MMMRIVGTSMNFPPVGTFAATAAQDEQSISHDWHSTERYSAVRSPALTWISNEALDARSRPVQIYAGHRGTRETPLFAKKGRSWERSTAAKTAPDRQQWANHVAAPANRYGSRRDIRMAITDSDAVARSPSFGLEPVEQTRGAVVGMRVGENSEADA